MNTDSEWNVKYAFYAASLFRLGYYLDAGMISALLFDRYLEDQFELYDDLNMPKGKGYIEIAINELSPKDYDRYHNKFLHELRTIRNKIIIHPEYQVDKLSEPSFRKQIKDKIHKLVTFTWKHYDPQSYKIHHSINGIPTLKADYAIMEIKEILQDNLYVSVDQTACRKISASDFEDLYVLRNKMLHFGQYVSEHLLCKFEHLDIDLISKIDTTSAYIWLAINLHRGTPEVRDRISGASAALLATPLDLRIYLDFGGEAINERKEYYSFLLSDEYQDFISSYSDEPLIMFDVDWYCFITKQNNPSQVNNVDMAAFTKSALDKLEDSEKKKSVITWNRNLIGYILPRVDIRFTEITCKLEVIIKLYYYFEKYRNSKNRKRIPWIPKNDYLLDVTNSCLQQPNFKIEAYNENDY